MSYTVTEENLDNLKSYWKDREQKLDWPSVFVVPDWLKVWWQVFASDAGEFVRVVRQDDSIIGIAPLMVQGKTASFIGNTDVCDYLDFIAVPGMEIDFLRTLLDDLKQQGIKQLDLRHVRSDSTVMTGLLPLAGELGYSVDSTQEEISVEMDLPPTWDEYLATLSSKQRHEVRRKLRRLSESGEISYRFISERGEVPDAMDAFFRMFVESRRDKAEFMTERMEIFFRRLAEVMAETGLLRLGVLELDDKPVAEIMCFDYNDCVYLYNSGYDPEYTGLSAGLLSKVMAVQDSIEKGRKKFDFLKGAEAYKYHLGGKEVPLYRCLITLK
jgi:CelD/BcsL family acetyltransferase involved in cellulose biosynthesis